MRIHMPRLKKALARILRLTSSTRRCSQCLLKVATIKVKTNLCDRSQGGIQKSLKWGSQLQLRSSKRWDILGSSLTLKSRTLQRALTTLVLNKFRATRSPSLWRCSFKWKILPTISLKTTKMCKTNGVPFSKNRLRLIKSSEVRAKITARSLRA